MSSVDLQLFVCLASCTKGSHDRLVEGKSVGCPSNKHIAEGQRYLQLTYCFAISCKWQLESSTKNFCQHFSLFLFFIPYFLISVLLVLLLVSCMLFTLNLFFCLDRQLYLYSCILQK
ncbi:hypothetical protein GALMADRAFT_1047688 [Galerina marginata CBS 339.88]|uniref:Uncharacterized protein n=1 Tax=Galerina marginata (strain CBS 339.88) TaxID=685588 RepID=A0A067SC78_GALM3|nr:hypothetical protein GALMADRAFT_1047688 [Galerina marginata CBS 339.88]